MGVDHVATLPTIVAELACTMSFDPFDRIHTAVTLEPSSDIDTSGSYAFEPKADISIGLAHVARLPTIEAELACMM